MKKIAAQVSKMAAMDPTLAKLLRKGHLIRHQFVAWPLLEYTKTEQSLVRVDSGSLSVFASEKLPDDLRDIAPRFIHLDELLLFYLLNDLDKCQMNKMNRLADVLKENEYWSAFIDIPCREDSSSETDWNDHGGGNQKDSCCIRRKEPHTRSVRIKDAKRRAKEQKLCVGVASLQVSKSDYERSYHPTKRPNLSIERQTTIFNLINEAIKKPKCDLVVFPEVSVPYAWLPFMVKQARRNDIGMIFGLEHWVVNKNAYNLVATVLPFWAAKEKYHNCVVFLRNKNHYAPKEAIDLESLDLAIPDEEAVYDLFSWRGCHFTVYNCFELTDVRHRGLLRSNIDLLVSIAWNRDVNYFSSIIESTVRDLHCFMVHANTSQYGDSRMVEPESTEKKDIVRIKGGENAVLLKGLLDVEELRDFQSHRYRTYDDRYKPTPAGFDHEEARDRSRGQ